MHVDYHVALPCASGCKRVGQLPGTRESNHINHWPECNVHGVLWCCCLQPAFPPELDGQLGPQLIEAWGFLTGESNMPHLVSTTPQGHQHSPAAAVDCASSLFPAHCKTMFVNSCRQPVHTTTMLGTVVYQHCMSGQHPAVCSLMLSAMHRFAPVCRHHIAGFADLLGMPAISMESLLSALLQGSSSPLLGLVHILLLRQAQADMEYSHATGCLQVSVAGGPLAVSIPVLLCIICG